MESDPWALVQVFIDAWAHGTSSDIVNLFAEEIEYDVMLRTTSRLELSAYQEYWLALNGKLLLEGCDPPQGDTIRCDLVYESDCERLTGFGPWHWNTSFTIKHGKIEKAVVTDWGPGELEKRNEMYRAVFEWAPHHSGDAYALYRYEGMTLASERTFDRWQEMGNLLRRMCAAYGASLTPPPQSTATP